MAVKMMKAVWFEGYGGGATALKHAEIPVPTPKKDEILLQLEATSLNAFDWKIQKGVARPLLPRKFPYILGQVVKVGSSVMNFRVGDKVVSTLSHTTGGGLAEYAVVPENLTVNMPHEVSAAEGAGLPIAALTANEALTTSAGLKLDGSGKKANVLITAASGGVGHYAVQLAKLGNTHVTTACGAVEHETWILSRA